MVELSNTLLRAEAVTRRYGVHTVLDGVTLESGPGEVLAIVGPNGSGKSTLFRILLRLELPDRGAVLFGGEPLTEHVARTRMAGVFQRSVLFSGTVQDNVSYGLRTRSGGGVLQRMHERFSLAGTWGARSARVEAVLDRLGIRELARADVRTLSGGEAQRVALARALVLEPDVILLDEPTAGLDAMVRRSFLRDLDAAMREWARGAIVITHDARDVIGLADRVAVLQNGRLVQVGTPADVLSRPATPFVAELFASATARLAGIARRTS